MQSKKILISNCYRVQDYDIVDHCADIYLIIDKASEEFDDFIFLGNMNGRNQLFWNQDMSNTEGCALHTLFQAFDFD